MDVCAMPEVAETDVAGVCPATASITASTTASTRGGALVAGVAVSLPGLSGAEGSNGPALSSSKG